MSDDFKPRRYACMQWPSLRLRHDIKFEHGFLTVGNQEDADLVERNQAFGKQIHPIKYDPKPVPESPSKVEELIESEIVSALSEKQPRARRGAIGTR